MGLRATARSSKAMRRFFLRLACITGVIVVMMGLAGFWYLRVTPVTVINISPVVLRNVEIDLQGKRLIIGTLEPRDSRKVYGIPGRGSMMTISLVSQGHAVHREVDYMEGSEGIPQVVLIFSAENINSFSVPGRFLK